MKNNILILEDNSLLNKKINSYQKKIINIHFSYISFIIIFILLISNLYCTIKLVNYRKTDLQVLKNENISYKIIYKYNYEQKYLNEYKFSNFSNTSIETTDLNILKKIENEIKNYIELIPEEQKFMNGLIRKIKPRKIVEIGVSRGGSSALILNAIKDIKGSKLYSIDKSTFCYKEKNKKTGFIVEEKFPELLHKWSLFTGGITSEFIEIIGDEIDLVFIDTMHITPGEMLDWLMVLPFLKNEAIVVFHDAFFLYYNKDVTKYKLHTSNNQLLCYIRGELILPHYGESVFFRNIGALKLAPEQNKYYYQYFLSLGIQWEYMPSENDLKLMRDFFLKYYGKKYVEVYDDALEKNKIYLNNFNKKQ